MGETIENNDYIDKFIFKYTPTLRDREMDSKDTILLLSSSFKER